MVLYRRHIPSDELDPVDRDHRLSPHEFGPLRRVDHLTVHEFQIVDSVSVKVDELPRVEDGPLGLPGAARGRSGGDHDAGDELELAIFPSDRDQTQLCGGASPINILHCETF